MAKRASGGKRAVQKKHRERTAARLRAKAGGDPRAAYQKSVSNLADPTDTKSAFTWMGELAIRTVKATALDPGLPFEQLRRDVMRQLEQASKICEPGKLSDELSELEEALEELRQHHAGNVEEGASRSSSTGVDLAEPVG